MYLPLLRAFLLMVLIAVIAVPAFAVPADPSNPSPNSGTVDRPLTQTLSWNSVIGATGYDVYFGTVSNPTTLVSSNQSTRTYDPGTLDSYQTYYWKVVARGSTGVSPGANIWNFRTILVAPDDPQPTDPVNGELEVATNSILNWSAPRNATSYRVYFGTANPPPQVSASQTAQTYNPGTMTNYTTYYWKVQAINSAGTSLGDTIWSFQTIGVPNYQWSTSTLDFGNIFVGFGSNRTVTLSNNGTDTGTVSITPAVSGDFSIQSPTSPFSLIPGGSQTITIRYYSNLPSTSSGTFTANGGNSPTLNVSGSSSIMTPTAVLASDSTDVNCVHITWHEYPLTTFFRVYRNTINNSATATALGTWNSTASYNDSTAIAGTNYYYWVKAAFNDNGYFASGFSNYDIGSKLRPTTLAVAPNPIAQYPATGSSQDFTVTIGGGTPMDQWSIYGIPSWISLNRVNGAGTRTVAATAAANSGIARSDSFQVYLISTPTTFQWVKVSQAAGPITFSVSTNPIAQFPYLCDTLSTTINIGGGNPTANWTASSIPAWITLLPQSGAGTTTLSVIAATNTGIARSDSFQVSCTGATGSPVWVKVSQVAGPITFSVSPTTIPQYSNAGSAQNVTITIGGGNPSATWTTSNVPSWITLNPTTYAGTRIVSVTASANSGPARADSFQVTCSGATGSPAWVKVSQAAAPITIMASPSTMSQFSNAGSTQYETVTVGGGNPSATWTTSSIPSWISLNPTTFAGTRIVAVTASANTGVARSDSFQVICAGAIGNPAWVKVNQAAGPITLSVSPTTVPQYSNAGSAQNVTITIGGGNPSATWTTSNIPSWISLNPTTYAGTRTVAVTASANTGPARVDSFQVACTGATGSPAWIKVSQAAGVTTFAVSPTTIAQYTNAGGSQNLTVSIGGGNPSATWTTSSVPSWITLNPTTYAGTRTVAVTAATNTGLARTDSFLVTCSGATGSPAWIKISQSIGTITLAVSPSTIAQFANSGGSQTANVSIGGINPSATWTIGSVPSWITVSPMTFSGSSSITVTTPTNTGITRSDSFQVACTGAYGSPFWVKVSQQTATFISVSPNPMPEFGPTQNSQIFTINVTGAYPWLPSYIASYPSWVSYEGIAGSNPQQIRITVNENTDSTRTDSLQLVCNGAVGSPLWVKISQRCYRTTILTSGSLSTFPYLQSSRWLNVYLDTENPNPTASISHLPSWIRVMQQDYLRPNYSYRLEATINTGPARTDSLLVVSRYAINNPVWVILSQEEGPTNLSVTPATLPQFTRDGGSHTLAVSVTGGRPTSSWSVTNIPAWINVTPTTFNGSGSVSVTVGANLSVANLDSFLITCSNATNSPKWVKVSQDPGLTTFAAAPTTLSQFSNTGGSQDVAVTLGGGNPNANCTTSNVPSWITLNPTTFSGSRSFTVSAAANTGLARSDSFQVASSGATGSPTWIKVSQAAGPAILSVSPTTLSQFATAGGTQNVTVSIGGGNPSATWTTSNVPSWITLNPSTLAGSSSISVTAMANTGIARADSFQVASSGATGSPVWIKVSQAPIPATLSVTPTTVSQFTNEGGSQNVTVTIGGGIPSTTWTTSNLPGWITLTPTTFDGSRTISITAAANSGIARADSFQVASSGATGSPVWVKVSQAAGATTFAVTPTTLVQYSNAGGSQNLAVSVGGGNPSAMWTSNNVPDWITLTPDTFVGSSDVTVTAAVNLSVARADSFQMICNDLSSSPIWVRVTQAAGATTFSVSPTTLAQFTCAGGSQDITVSVGGGDPTATWTSSYVPSWITLDPTSFSGSSNISVTAAENSGIARADSFQIACDGATGSPVWVKVDQHQGATILAVEPAIMPQFGNSGGSLILTVNIGGGNPLAEWTTSNVPSWISLNLTTSTGSYNIIVTAAANLGIARADSFQVSCTGATGSPVWILVSQAEGATTFAVTPTTLSQYPIVGGSQEVTVSVGGGNPLATWITSNVPSWITVSSPSFAGSSMITVTADTNRGFARADSFQVICSGATGSPVWVKVSQAPIPTTFAVSPTTLEQFAYSGGSQNVNVTIGGGTPSATWTTSNVPSWITLNPTTFAGSSMLTVTAAANTGLARSDSFQVASSGATGSPAWIHVSQEGGPISLSASPKSMNNVFMGMSRDFSIIISGRNPAVEWRLGVLPSWVTITPTSGIGTQTLRITSMPNGGVARVDSFQVFCDSATIGSPLWVVVKQNGGLALNVSPTTMTQFSNAGGSQVANITISGPRAPASWNALYLPSWITVNPLYGNESGSVTVTATANTGLARCDSFQIFCYLAVGSPAWIKVSQVGAPAQSVISPTTLNFGDIGTNLSDTANVIVRNNGYSTLEISDLTMSTSLSTTWTMPYPSVPVGDSIALPIVWTPNHAGDFTGTVIIHTNASNPVDTILITGTISAGSIANGTVSPSSAPAGSNFTFEFDFTSSVTTVDSAIILLDHARLCPIYSVSGAIPGTLHFSATASIASVGDHNTSFVVYGSGGLVIASDTLVGPEVTISALTAATAPVPQNSQTILNSIPTLSWVGDASHPLYDVYFGTSNPPETCLNANLTTSSLPLTNPLSNGTYYWYVVSHTPAASVNSTVWSFTVDASKPVVSIAYSIGSVELTWNATTFPRVSIYRSADSPYFTPFPATLLTTVPSAPGSYIDSPVSGRYFYKVTFVSDEATAR